MEDLVADRLRGCINMNRGFWKDRRVFLTGHTGFKGGWLALWLYTAGAEVIGFSLPASTVPSLFELAGVGEKIASLTGDIRDYAELQMALATHRPEIVIHMAAQSLVRESYRNPVENYATNVMGTVNLLQAVRSVPSVKVVLNVTTDKCYDNREQVWGYRECDPLGGRDPYSSSKACSEIVTAAFRHSYLSAAGVAVASARAGNVIGGGDWSRDRLIPDVMKAFANGEPVLIRHPDAVRPWQHVLEPLSGYMRLAERLAAEGDDYGEGWNFGPYDQDARPVSWVVEKLKSVWGGNARWELDTGHHPREAKLLKLDCSKARTHLGWKPRLSLEQALEWTAGWYRAVCNGQSALAVTLDQIARYEALVSEADKMKVEV